MARLLQIVSRVGFLTGQTMALNLDAYLGVHADALQVQARRMEVLANNLANVDTPNFKARDLDFRAALAAAGHAVNLSTTDARHVANSTATGRSEDLKYRTPLAPSLDGNTVDAQQEQAAFADNSVRYQATLTFLSSRFKNLMTAITGS